MKSYDRLHSDGTLHTEDDAISALKKIPQSNILNLDFKLSEKKAFKCFSNPNISSQYNKSKRNLITFVHFMNKNFDSRISF